MPAFSDNPFAVLSLIAAPAVLTNASSVLVLSTSNRFARTIDRARVLITQTEAAKTNPHPLTDMRIQHLARTEKRASLLLTAMTCFYLSLGSFVAASLMSIVGASLSAEQYH